MAKSLSGWYWHLGLASFIAMSGAIATSGNCVLAQITPDGTLPNNSVVTPQGNTSKVSARTTIVEATGWMVNDRGKVVLTATAPTANINIPWLPESNCNAPSSS